MELFRLILVLPFMWECVQSVSLRISPVDAAAVYDNATLKPCAYSLSGKWANTSELTVSPFPLKANQPVTIYFKFTAIDDLWYGNVRGNVTRLEDKWAFSMDTSICSMKGMCPLRQGDTREFNETFPAVSTYVSSGTYRLWAEVVNQDNEQIFYVTMHDCPL